MSKVPYYVRACDVFYMMETFGLRFTHCKNINEGSEYYEWEGMPPSVYEPAVGIHCIGDCIYYIKSRSRDKIYLHSDDREIFKPKNGDKGIDGADRLCKFILGKWVCWSTSQEPVYPVEIIKRDGKAFIEPKWVEVDE